MKFIYSSGIILALCVSCKSDTGTPAPNPQNNQEGNGQEVIEKPEQARTFPELLMELELHINWSAVDARWESRRESWGQDCYDAGTTSEKASLLLELETYILWDAVDEKWTTERDTWSQECLVAKNDHDLGKSLLKLESHILWTAVDEDWKSVRTDWVSRVGAIKG